jgi:hypothetical protein
MSELSLGVKALRWLSAEKMSDGRKSSAADHHLAPLFLTPGRRLYLNQSNVIFKQHNLNKNISFSGVLYLDGSSSSNLAGNFNVSVSWASPDCAAGQIINSEEINFGNSPSSSIVCEEDPGVTL